MLQKVNPVGPKITPPGPCTSPVAHAGMGLLFSSKKHTCPISLVVEDVLAPSPPPPPFSGAYWNFMNKFEDEDVVFYYYYYYYLMSFSMPSLKISV